MTGEVFDVLTYGEIEVHARFANSSNATLLVSVTHEATSIQAVYKPEAGERPLWDFPSGLWRREVAAYALSEAMGLGLVPPTVARTEGPLGPGSLQLFVTEDGDDHYFTLRDEPEHVPTLRSLAAFDVVANNSDRKSGHVLLADGQLWAIDHGLCFHEDDKLRTVIWDFAGDPLDPVVAAGLAQIRDQPPSVLTELLSPIEVALVQTRAAELLDANELPYPDEEGLYPPYPWPLV